LDFLVDIGAWSFNALHLPEAIRRVLSAPGLGVGEVALVEQSRSSLVWPVDIMLGVDGGTVFFGHRRAFALDTTSSSVTTMSSASS
jgi:hypothetical protein